ncbi:DUF1870 family protein [Catenovulum sediminis]|uniref:DUF1870 family protein n=1 Tax=Catenovulum sediminis TaxID=1740262 RepID=A0ABV1RNC4_9ALTE
MSIDNYNNFELQAMRKLLMLDVSEAAECIKGSMTTGVTVRTWQRWEKGDFSVPEDIQNELMGCLQWRSRLIDECIEEYPFDSDETMQIKWYHTFEDFLVDYPDQIKLMWRIHQSVCAFMFLESDNIELSGTAPVNENSYMHKFFSGTTEEQLERKRMEEVLKRKGIE